MTKEFYSAIEEMLKVVVNERRGTDDEDKLYGPEYGRGNPCKTCGLIKCNFRNSDDATTFSYNIPENAMIASTLLLLSSVIKQGGVGKGDVANVLKYYGNEIKESIYKEGVLTDRLTNEKYFVLEVDGFGNSLFMDEPGYPSLISLPFIGFCTAENEIFINTKKRILSEKNPYYITGLCGSGVD